MMIFRKAFLGCSLLLACLSFPLMTIADEHAGLFNKFSLFANAEGEVDNDLLTAELVVEEEDRDAAKLANRINATMAWALNEAKKFPAVKVESGHYNTWPQHERKSNRIVGWRSSQALKIESDDFSAARKIVKVLQEKLQVRGLQLMAKPETRKAREDQLITDALNAFKARAALVRDNMGSPNYRIIDVHINTNSHQQPSHRANSRYMESDSMSKMAGPAIAAGTSTVSVSVNGQIQLY